MALQAGIKLVHQACPSRVATGSQHSPGCQRNPGSHVTHKRQARASLNLP
jgi:hypothetical protein